MSTKCEPSLCHSLKKINKNVGKIFREEIFEGAKNKYNCKIWNMLAAWKFMQKLMKKINKNLKLKLSIKPIRISLDFLRVINFTMPCKIKDSSKSKRNENAHMKIMDLDQKRTFSGFSFLIFCLFIIIWYFFAFGNAN